MSRDRALMPKETYYSVLINEYISFSVESPMTRHTHSKNVITHLDNLLKSKNVASPFLELYQTLAFFWINKYKTTKHLKRLQPNPETKISDSHLFAL